MTRAILYFLFEMVICGPLVFGNVLKMKDPFSVSNDVQSESLQSQERFEGKLSNISKVRLFESANKTK